MTTQLEQPTALQLAELLERGPRRSGYAAIAAELRRLHILNQELLEALKDFSDYVRNEQNSTDGAVTYSNTQIHRLVFNARAAIAKAEGEKQ